MSAGQVLCSLNKRAKVRSMTLIAQLRFQQLPLSLTLLYPTRFESRSGDAGSSLSASAYVPNFHSRCNYVGFTFRYYHMDRFSHCLTAHRDSFSVRCELINQAEINVQAFSSLKSVTECFLWHINCWGWVLDN